MRSKRSLRSLGPRSAALSLIVRRHMHTQEWIRFFDLCNELLGEGSHSLYHSQNWCSWITFDRITRDAGYWKCGLPRSGEYGDTGILDGGTWGQPFEYTSIAHLIIPSKFEFSDMYQGQFAHKEIEQNILGLSLKLHEEKIDHVISNWALELRLIPIIA
jgi:hypothetical protein